MKKTFIALAIISGLGISHAAYVWTGGSTMTTDAWNTKTNWELTEGTTWNDGSSVGPGLTGSNMWAPITVSNTTGTVGTEYASTLEGWNLNLTLTDSNLTFERIMKFQGGCSIDIDKDSSLTITHYWGGNDGGTINLNNAGIFNLAYSSRTQGGDGFIMNLYDTGIVNFSDQNHDQTNSAKIASLEAQLSGTEVGSVLTRQLISVTGEVEFSSDITTTYKFTDANGATMVAVDSMEELEQATVNSYFVTSNENGISVSYMIVPEPATASLSLLGLAALMIRRRRA